MADVITRLKVESNEYDSKIKRATAGLQHLEDVTRKTGSSFNNLSSVQINYVKSLGQMETVSRSVRGKISELSTAFVELRAQYNRLSAEEKMGEFGRSLSNSLDQLRTRINASKQELNSINSELANSGSSMSGLSNIVKELGSRFGVSSEITNALTTGTIAYTAAIGAAIYAVKEGVEVWAQFNEQLAREQQITTVTTGLQGGSADKLQAQLKSLSQTYDVDFREAADAATVLMYQFGQTGDEAFTLLAKGMQGMIQGDGPKLLQMIKQYGPAFQSAGISASELVAIIHNSEGGIFTDDNMRAIIFGLANIRNMTKQTSDALKAIGVDSEQISRQLRDGSITVFDALQIVSKAIDENKENVDAVGAAMQSVFGRSARTAGDNLGKAIAELNTNLDETVRQTGEMGESLERVRQSEEKLNVALNDTFGYDGFEVMSNNIKTSLITALAELLEGINMVSSEFRKLPDEAKIGLQSIVNPVLGLIECFRQLDDEVKETFENIASYVQMVSSPLAFIVTTLRTLGRNGSNNQMPPGWKPGNEQPITSPLARLGEIPFKSTPQHSSLQGTSHSHSPRKGNESQSDIVKAEENYAHTIASAQQQLLENIITSKQYDDLLLSNQQKLADAYLKAYSVTSDEQYLNSFRELAGNIREMRDITAASEVISKMLKEVESLEKSSEAAITLAQQKFVNGIISADDFNKVLLSNQQKLAEAYLKAYDVTSDEQYLNSFRTTKSLIDSINAEIANSLAPLEQIDATLAELREKLTKAGSPEEYQSLKSDIASVERERKMFTGEDDKSGNTDTIAVIQKVAGSLGQVATGLQQMGLKIPDSLAKSLNVIQGLTTVITSVQSIISTFSTSSAITLSANTTQLTTLNGFMPGLISAMWANAATPFANGGIVGKAAGGMVIPGNSFSGDNLRMPVFGGGMIGVNSGEMILNKVQTETLASMLDSSDEGSTVTTPYVTGENIYLGMSNFLNSSGQGEIVTTKMLRRLGVI